MNKIEIQRCRKNIETFLFILNSAPDGNVGYERTLKVASEIMQEAVATIKALEAQNEEMLKDLIKLRGDFYRSIIIPNNVPEVGE